MPVRDIRMIRSRPAELRFSERCNCPESTNHNMISSSVDACQSGERRDAGAKRNGPGAATSRAVR